MKTQLSKLNKHDQGWKMRGEGWRVGEWVGREETNSRYIGVFTGERNEGGQRHPAPLLILNQLILTTQQQSDVKEL